MGLRVGSSKINGVKVVGEDISRSVIITEETLPNGGIVKHFRGVAEGEWVRPSDWPDLSKLDRTGQVVYITYPADEINGYLGLCCSPTYKVAIGHIENNEYVVESETSQTSNTFAYRYFGEVGNTGYKVIRITSTGNIIKFTIGYSSSSSGSIADGHPMNINAQYALEIYGNLPYCTTFSATRLGHVQCVDVKNIKPTTMASAFKSCRKLKAIKSISTWDMSACTSLLDIFNACTSLEKVDVTNLCSSACTNAGGVFNNCVNLKEADLSTWNTSAVTAFHYLFYCCRSLRNIIFPSQFVKSTVTNIGYMFYGVNSLKSLDMSDWNTSNVTNMQWMFSYQTALDVIDFTGLDLAKVTSTANNNGMYGMTSAGTAYKIIFPSSVTVIGQFCLNTSQDIVSALWEYHFLSTSPPTMGGTYLARAVGNNNIKVYVPYSSDHSILEAYKTATNWSTYASLMVEEPQGE